MKNRFIKIVIFTIILVCCKSQVDLSHYKTNRETSFGFVAKNKSTTKEIYFVNLSEEPVEIIDVLYPENFEGPNLENMFIRPFDSLAVSITYHAIENVNYFDSIIYITENIGEQKVYVNATSIYSEYKKTEDAAKIICNLPLINDVNDISENNYQASEIGNVSFNKHGAFFEKESDYVEFQDFNDVFEDSQWSVSYEIVNSKTNKNYSKKEQMDSISRYKINLGCSYIFKDDLLEFNFGIGSDTVVSDSNIFYQDYNIYHLFYNNGEVSTYINGNLLNKEKLKIDDIAVIYDLYLKINKNSANKKSYIRSFKIYDKPLVVSDVVEYCKYRRAEKTVIDDILTIRGKFDFGFVAKSKTTEIDFVIANNHSYPMSIKNVRYPLGFNGNIDGTIPPQTDTVFKLTFMPSAYFDKDYVGDVNLYTDSDDQIDIAVTGTNIFNEELSKDIIKKIDFGYVKPSSKKELVVKINNIFNFDFSIDEIVVPDDFTVKTASRILIPKNSSKEFTLKFHPKEAKIYSDKVKIVTSIGIDLNVRLIAKSDGVPEVKTKELKWIAATSYVCHADLIHNGGHKIIARGIIWGVNNNVSFNTKYEGCSIDEKKGKEFTGKINELVSDKEFYVRAYAKNKNGIAYGEIKKLSTKVVSYPRITTVGHTEVSYSYFMCGGEISGDGFLGIISKGIVLSSTGDPSLERNDKVFNNTDDSNVFKCKLNGLKYNTSYTVRAFVTNVLGTTYGQVLTVKTKSFNEMVTVNGGSFFMGSSTGSPDEKPVHLVMLNDFEIGKYEVTESEWNYIMHDEFKLGENEGIPKTKISWADAMLYIKKLNLKTGKKYRLPTEAEWEYAARGGEYKSTYVYSGSENIDVVAFYFKGANTFKNSPKPVGTYSPNILGLFDMSGNVWEWCYDRYHSAYYEKSEPENPSGPYGGLNKIYRGGSFKSKASYCTVSFRHGSRPNVRRNSVGFRLARSISD